MMSRICWRDSGLSERPASDFGAVSSGASPSSLRISLISAMSTPFAESAFMKAFLIARTSSWEIDFVFALRRWTWLLILVSLDSRRHLLELVERDVEVREIDCHNFV